MRLSFRSVFFLGAAAVFLGCFAAPALAADPPASEIVPEDALVPTLPPDSDFLEFEVDPMVLNQRLLELDPAKDKVSRNKDAKIDLKFDSVNFDDNIGENGGFVFIPPDPIGAAGPDRVIAVVNVMIECRTKGGQYKWRDGLSTFFAPLAPLTPTFDPKIVYDEHAGRFVVVTLERLQAGGNLDPGNQSRILLAVSKDSNPETGGPEDWWFHAIDSKVFFNTTLGVRDGWADYPGFEVDEEAVYITANLFGFSPSFGFGSLLWIVDKGMSGGFYDGGPASVDLHSPYSFGGVNTTTMPAQIHGEGGVGGPGSAVGTFLVSYSGLVDGTGMRYVQVITVSDPLGAAGGPTFAQQFIPVGMIDSGGGLPDAPQAGSSTLIEVNDRRALDAVWRDGKLWMTTTILPPSGPEAGQTTAHWFMLDTSGGPGALTLGDQGDLTGEDIAAGTYTFFPSVAVNPLGDVFFGFSGSAPSIYAGAFAAGREADDAPGTVQPTLTVRAGVDVYKRTFSSNPTARNRWGDYSGICVDPVETDKFWVFNEYADMRGTPTNPGPEDGRWGTAWARVKFLKEGPRHGVVELMPGNVVDARLALHGASPNPFLGSTVVRYDVPADGGAVRLAVYDVTGRKVRTLVDGVQTPGAQAVAWDGTDELGRAVAPGVYLARLEAAGEAQVQRLLLTR